MDNTSFEFYFIRLRLLLMNPFELLFLVSAPVLILWNSCKQKKRSFLWMGLIFSFAGWLVIIASATCHFHLIERWINKEVNPPSVLMEMMNGDGPKMVVAYLLGGGYAAFYYTFWFIVTGPFRYWYNRKYSVRVDNIPLELTNDNHI